jgi:hypothetical protein
MSEKVTKTAFVGVKMLPDEREALEKQAQSQGLSLSKLIRTRLLGEPGAAEAEVRRPHVEQPEPAAETPPASRTWEQEWRDMAQMEPVEALARFRELAAGRTPPAGFSRWPIAQRCAWLERNWPL